MNKIRYIYAVITVLGAMCLCPIASLVAQDNANEASVKVMTYNIFSARKMGIEAIADVIKKVNPDLASLQEVERHTNVNPMDFPKEIAVLTGMPYYYFIHALDIPSGGDYGNVILSKYPLEDMQTFKLGTVEPKDYVRSFGYARISKSGKEFYFAATHLDHKKDDATRLKQVEEILGIVRKLDKPVILGGDLNSRRGSATIPALEMFFTVDCLSDSCPWTVPTPTPTYACDWLLYAPKDAFRAKDYSVCYWADKESDHFPVVAIFGIK
jgi:endonuclease/exonuclease/phosphatase family metal-dependent hydrolase